MKIKDAIKDHLKFILVGCDAAKERDGMSELWHVLIKFCNIQPIEAFELPIRGLFLIALQETPQVVLPQLGNIIDEKKFSFLVNRKFTPIEKLIPCSLDKLAEEISPFLERIPENATWRISINRRHTTLKKNAVIEAIVRLPQCPRGKVDLTKPEWDVIVELFGKWIGFGVCPANSVIKI